MSQTSRSSALSRIWAVIRKLTIVLDIVPGVIVGALLALTTALLLITAQFNAMQTTVNGWNITMTCGRASNGILVRAACAQHLFAVNLPEEAVYYTTTVDGAGQTLTGAHDYVLHFALGGLPPVDAFWSLTMTDPQGHLVATPSNRYNVGDRSGLMPNADGSIDIYIQTSTPTGHEANWLPSPTGPFMLWLRAYQPGAATLNGSYHLPPVKEAQ